MPLVIVLHTTGEQNNSTVLTAASDLSVTKPLNAWWPICRPLVLMHVMSSRDLSAAILSALSALLIHKILAAIALLNNVSALRTMYFSNSLFQQGISF
jgi:hypothetical protein